MTPATKHRNNGMVEEFSQHSEFPRFRPSGQNKL